MTDIAIQDAVNAERWRMAAMLDQMAHCTHHPDIMRFAAVVVRGSAGQAPPISPPAPDAWQDVPVTAGMLWDALGSPDDLGTFVGRVMKAADKMVKDGATADIRASGLCWPLGEGISGT